jgi:hypothetical protein
MTVKSCSLSSNAVHQLDRRSVMSPNEVPPAALGFLTAAVLMAVFVAGGLSAVVAYAIALELWIRFLTPEPVQVRVRHEDDRQP